MVYISNEYDNYPFKTKRNFRIDGKYEPFVYIIQEVETEMVYIGSRTKFSGRPCLESDLGNIYFSSSKEFDWSTDLSSFEICRIISCASNHDALILESKLIDQNGAVWDNNFYNNSRSGAIFNMSGAVGELNPMYGKCGPLHHGYGCIGPMHNKKHSQESKAKMSDARKDYWANNPRLCGDKNSFYGRRHSIESREKIASAAKNRSKSPITCPHCGKCGKVPNVYRYHFNNCKGKK